MKNQHQGALLILGLLFVIFSSNAQTPQSELDQLELIEQFVGTWEGELAPDTVFIGVNRAFGTGLISESYVIASGDTIQTIQQLFGYDKKLDKFILAELIESSPVIEVCHVWFTSERKGKIVIVNPDNAPFSWTFEFIGPKFLKQSAILKGEIVKTLLLQKSK